MRMHVLSATQSGMTKPPVSGLQHPIMGITSLALREGEQKINIY